MRTNQEYLRGTAFGIGFPVQGARLSANVPPRIEYETGDFSFLLNLEELQRSQAPAAKENSDTEFSIFEKPRSLNQETQNLNGTVGFSIEEF